VLDAYAPPRSPDKIGPRAKLLAAIGRSLARTNKLLVLVVLVPTTLTIWYFGFVARDVYISESEFVVRDQQHATAGALGGLLHASGLYEGHNEAYSVQDFLSSRDALGKLDHQFHLSHAFAAANGDLLSGFPGLMGDGSFEALLRYYRNHVVDADFDSNSSILKLTVRAFDASNAHAINEALLQMSEDFVNTLNERARTDLMKSAIADVADAEHEVKAAAEAVSLYRNGSSVFDPEKQSALQLAQIGKLQEELIATRNQTASIQAVAADNPQLADLRTRAAALQRAIDSETAKVAGGQQSLSSKSAQYEALVLTQTFADKRLEIALLSMQQARENAVQQQLYLERIEQPNQPDAAIEPKRLRNATATFVLCLIVWGVLSLLSAAVREHGA
jgi:capsular polysaccharide transport system permease protein